MAKTIGNPITWMARNAASTSDHISESVGNVGSAETQEMPQVRKLTQNDLRAAFRAGYEDFLATRADVVVIVAIYPFIGLVLVGLGLRMDMIPLLAPLVMGFALMGPVAGIGFYEVSRRREKGLAVNWLDALSVFRSPSFGAILALSLYLALLYIVWLMTAQSIYAATLGPEPPASLLAFAGDVVGTPLGWTMVIIGSAVGFLFALLALSISVVSFPLLLDRKVGVPVAVVTSVRVMRKNPGVTLTWGALVAGLLVVASIPILLGLIVVLPVLGHATWHLYRRAVE
ncbi:MAG: DUF2189 domain-containing protein [Pseudomonadota bacterium]